MPIDASRIERICMQRRREFKKYSDEMQIFKQKERMQNVFREMRLKKIQKAVAETLKSGYIAPPQSPVSNEINNPVKLEQLRVNVQKWFEEQQALKMWPQQLKTIMGYT